MTRFATAPLSFVQQPSPVRVVFADGAAARLADEVDHLRLSRVLVLSTPGRRALADAVAADLGARAAGVHDGAAMHVPTHTVDAALAVVRDLGADGLVAAGGGSTIGLAKALALRTGLPIIALPTTYAGSEMTPVWGLTEDGRKRTGRDPRVLPRTVVYDPTLSADLPVGLSVTSGINAIAHAVEGLYAPDRTPLVAMNAAESVRALAAGLPLIARDPRSAEGRHLALYGAWLAGSTVGAATMGLHHKLCHALGGALNLPHAETHTVLLPHALAFTAPALDADTVAALTDALGRGDRPPADALRDMAAELGAPASLSALGADRAALRDVAAQAARDPYATPRPASAAQIAALLDAAWLGAAPTADPR